MKILTLFTLHALTLASLAQSTIPLMVGTNGNVLAPFNFWSTAPVLTASGGLATNATIVAPLPVTNYDLSLLYITNCTDPNALGTYSNVTGRPYEYAKNYTESGSDYWTSVTNGSVRLNSWQTNAALLTCPTNGFPTGLGGGMTATNVTTNTTALTVLGDVVAREFKGRFAITASGQTATIAAGSLTFADGSSYTIQSGWVKLGSATTNYIFLDLQDFSFHAFPRAIHSGGVYLGTVVTKAGGAPLVAQPAAFATPPNPAEIFKRKVWSGRTNIYCVVAGDSLSADWTAYMSWAKAIFTPPATNLTFALPGYTNLIYDNVALGGASSIWSWALLCSSSLYGVQGASFMAPSVTFVNRDVGANLTNPIQTSVESPILSRIPDLLIIGFGANRDDTYDAIALETIVREYTARGCAVIITTENKYGGPMPLAEASSFLQSLATRYGASIADTYAYVYEKNVFQGTNTYQGDGVHQVQEGWNCYARAVRSVLNDYPQIDGTRNAGMASRISLNVTNGFQTNAPNWIHVQPAKWRSAGTATDLNGMSPLSIATKTCGIPQSQAVQQIVSSKAYFSFPLASAVYLVTENNVGTNTVIDLSYDITHVFKTLTVTGTGNGIQITKLLSESEIRSFNTYDYWSINPPEYRPVGFSLGTNGASGPLYLSAILYLGPKITSISPAAAQLGGTGWNTESWRYNSVDYPNEPVWFNDTTNGSITVAFKGNGIVVPVGAGSSAAMISAWVDGEQLLNSRDMYLAGNTGIVRYFSLFPRNSTGALPLWFNYGDHTLRLSWPGQNASVGASANGNRRAAVIQSLTAIDNR